MTGTTQKASALEPHMLLPVAISSVNREAFFHPSKLLHCRPSLICAPWNSCLNQVISNNSSSFLAASTAGTAPCPLCRKLYVRIKAKKLHVDRPDPPKMPEYLGHLERLASCCHEKSTAATWEDAIRHTVQWLEEQQPDEVSILIIVSFSGIVLI